MKKFQAIEGLRGVLAWAVVFSHLVYFADIYTHGFGGRIAHLGRPAVLIFIIVSGFVITHVIIERPEPYGSYLTRRFIENLSAIRGYVGDRFFRLRSPGLHTHARRLFWGSGF